MTSATVPRRLHAMVVLALLASLAFATPARAQVGGVRAGAADTAGAGGAPSLRSLVARSRRDSDLRVLVQRFDADRAALGRRYDIPHSPVLHARLRAFYHGWQARLQELNANELNAAGKADLTALRNRIRTALDTVAIQERQFAELTPLLPFARTLQLLQERRRERLDVDPMEAAQTLNDVMKDVMRLTATLTGAAEAGRPTELRGIDATTAARAIHILGALPPAEGAPARPTFGASPTAATLRATLDSWYSFYHGYDPLFTWWVRKPYEELTEALEAYARAIQRAWAVATESD